MRTDSGTSGLSRLEASHAAISAALLQGNVGIGVFLTGIVDQKSARKERLFWFFLAGTYVLAVAPRCGATVDRECSALKKKR